MQGKSKLSLGRDFFVDRRRFLMMLGVTGASTLSRDTVAAVTQIAPTLYYMDGYHGGARGHMPPGCWRDIVEAMDRNPGWKLSLDVEAPSWEVLLQQDPEAFQRLKRWMGSRVEITGGTFAQPYGWAISGESNIRQLEYGLELIGKHFGETGVKTYAVQEPCWSSCLPQILRSFGFTGASLKNASTAWGGYTRGLDAELVNWIGPDGSSIVAVPRYESEELLHVWETEATEVSPAYAEKCVKHGIPEPAGMCFQDLGWVARPRAAASWIRYATWTEYIHTVAQTKPVDWIFSMEDILTALPWGEKTLHRVALQVREAEISLVFAEKLAALDYLRNRTEWPAASLKKAWEQTLWSQTHDAWITATTRTGRDAWAFQVASETLDASEIGKQLSDQAMSRIAEDMGSKHAPQSNVQYVRVANTLGHDRTDLVEITIAANHGTQAFEVTDSKGMATPSQAVIVRKFRELHEDSDGVRTPIFEGLGVDDGETVSINAATILFRGEVPAFGWNTYKIVALDHKPVQRMGPAVGIQKESDGRWIIESDLYRICLDEKRGGAISSLYQKQEKREFCSGGKLVNVFRGYFAEGKSWKDSSESPARIEVLEAGPIRVKIKISGEIGGCAFVNLISIGAAQARIDCHVTFRFNEDTWIGDPWDIKPEDRMKERRRSSNDGRWKLQAIFPVDVTDGTIYKNSAFDVCKSRNASTHFERWDEIKHNIITNWVDLIDARKDIGLAIFSDRTTAYSYGEGEPLGLVLGWSGEGGFWWGRSALRGEQESAYAIVPHRGLWSEASLWQETLGWEEPLKATVMPHEPSTAGAVRFMLRLSSSYVVLSAVTVRGKQLHVRLFNAHDQEQHCRVEFDFHAGYCRLVELNGDPVKELPLHHGSGTRSWTELSIPKFGIRTLSVY